MSGNFVGPDLVPAAVVQATREMARESLIVDRTAAPTGEGVDFVATAHATHDASGNPNNGAASPGPCVGAILGRSGPDWPLTGHPQGQGVRGRTRMEKC